MKGPNKKLVVFDFDGTLIWFDTTKLYILILMICFPVRTLFALLRLNNACEPVSSRILRVILKDMETEKLRVPSNIYKSIVSRFLGGEAMSALRHFSAQADWKVLIATASPAFFLKRLGLGVSIVAYEFEESKGRFTGNEMSHRPHGEEKLKQVKAWMKEAGYSDVTIAYGDSNADLPLLGFAKKAYLVKNGRARLIKDSGNLLLK